MNRAYVVSNDGLVFYADEDSDYLNLLECNESNNNVKIKRLSSSPWCLWTISANLNLYLFVYMLDAPFEHQEITYENQRRYNILNLNSFSDRLFPTDRPNFSSQEGDISLPKDKFQLPTKNWVWKNEWTYENNSSDGWEYSIDFPSTYHPSPSISSFVRRRKWTRNRIFVTYNQFIQIKNPLPSECIIDVSIGGWLVPFVEKGFLSVWIVSNKGRLYFRKNVSHSSLEGDSWLNVKLPHNFEAFNCSCSVSGSLWVINDQGEALMRTGISREVPYGIGWLSIAPPTDVTGIKEISAGLNSVWCIDNLGKIFYRSGVTNRKPQGDKWVFIPIIMSNISCSLTDQILTINLIDNKIFFRDGIDEENLSGTAWKEIKLKYRVFNHSESEFKSRPNSVLNYFSLAQDPSPIFQQETLADQKSTDKIAYIEDSIYEEDSIYDSGPALYKITQESKEQLEGKINLNDFKTPDSVSELGKQVQETNKQLDKYIDELIRKDEIEEVQEKSRSESMVSFQTRDSSFEELNSNFSNEESLVSFQQVDLDYHSICINSMSLQNIPIRWYDSESQPAKKCLEINSKWRDQIFNELIKRNLREFRTIDKISVPYANDTSWSRTDSVQMLHRKKLVPCTLEIIHCDNSTRKLLVISIKQKSKIIWKKEINFSDILLIKPFLIEPKRSALSFAIYLNDKLFSEFIFVTSSKNQLNNWLNQISIYCSKIHFFHTLSNALSLVTSDGYSYFSYLNNIYKPIYLNQIDGHFKQIEKHSSGVTFGCGENGKLWILDVAPNKPLDCYKGPYSQSDELEIYTYENQRWNIITGIFGSKMGFTKIGLPTDRYHWSDETGKIRRRKEECHLPSPMFNWISSWQVDYSLQPGVDKDGWQYAVDFPASYHAVCNPITHFVRRRRWVRKCRIISKGLWTELNQFHKLKCIAIDQEMNSKKNFLAKNEILLWSTDSFGCVLSAVLTSSDLSNFKWKYVNSDNQSFSYVSIGPDLKIWSIDTDGNVYYRAGVSRENNFCGTDWNRINFDEKESNVEKFEQISVGKYCVWAISRKKEIYFRQNISRSFPEGTNWVKIDSNFKYVTLNAQNQVFAITSETAARPNKLMIRKNVTSFNLKGTDWEQVIPIDCKMVSNKGFL